MAEVGAGRLDRQGPHRQGGEYGHKQSCRDLVPTVIRGTAGRAKGEHATQNLQGHEASRLLLRAATVAKRPRSRIVPGSAQSPAVFATGVASWRWRA